MADAKRRLYERAGAVITDDEHASGIALAVVALENDDEAMAAVVRLKARGLLVNAVDRSALCDYTTPAIIDRDPVLIAIGTGGASAGLAKALRQRLEQLLDPNGPLDVLADHKMEDMEAWLDQPHGQARSQVIDLELASADPDDLTLRQARWLGQADQIFASDDVPEAVLVRARADAERFTLSFWDEQPTTGLTLRIRMKI
mgnify:CR=1 FL=1